ncbi:efflux RND transporter periplasmic adaptor subunit [Phaeovibrio sulfidiphilus]|uniref:Efflux RND transporter periplasmic adaptor subunit n=1 Tax=Phaeovibrio sulfidiphilus TaxID=1220600 RepID=A0A8J6YKN4_9PROT|nr:efflux RND transporter periplasmic adaptor subunit [Phaeovibrio sulfidiphilus]MBE1236355.1 efflux RND transporter periplasmic adaptor subunit [Phaeovibrio sulfidiphilus]
MNRVARIVVASLVGVVIFGGLIAFVLFANSARDKFLAAFPKAVITVTVGEAALEQWAETVPAVGTLRAINGVDVSAEVSGQVRHIDFQSGERVSAGQLLVQLDISEEMSQLASARATEKLASITAERARSLVRTSAGTKANLDDAVAQLEVASASCAQIEARIAKKTIMAPFEGFLGVREVDLGEYVAPGQVIVNLQDISSIFADFTVSQRQLSLLKVGQKLRMTVDSSPGRVFEGRVTAIAPLVNVRTGMVSVEGLFENPDLALRPGMLARVEAVQDREDAVIVLPATAVTYQLSGDTVFVVTDLSEDDRANWEKRRSVWMKAAEDQAAALQKQAAGEKDAVRKATLEKSADVILRDARDQPWGQYAVERRMVVVGDRQDDRVVIVKGLSENERVVTSGQMKLESGSNIFISDTEVVPTRIH